MANKSDFDFEEFTDWDTNEWDATLLSAAVHSSVLREKYDTASKLAGKYLLKLQEYVRLHTGLEEEEATTEVTSILLEILCNQGFAAPVIAGCLENMTLWSMDGLSYPLEGVWRTLLRAHYRDRGKCERCPHENRIELMSSMLLSTIATTSAVVCEAPRMDTTGKVTVGPAFPRLPSAEEFELTATALSSVSPGDEGEVLH